MYVERVRLENIRGFTGGRNVDLRLPSPGWTVIAGRNGSGKTSLLRAIALAVAGPDVARSLVPDFAKWVSSRSVEGSVFLGLAYDAALDSGTRLPALFDTPRTTGVELVWSGADQRSLFAENQPTLNGRVRGDSKRLWQPNPVGWFCAAYGPFRRLAGGARDAQKLMRSHGPVARLASLFDEDASLAEGVGWLIDQHLRSLEGKPGAEKLKDVALRVLGDGLLPDGYRIEGVDSDGLWVEHDDHQFPLREMSDGYRTVTALVVDLIKQINDCFGELPVEVVDGRSVITAPGTVIIDKVDAHLHVSWQKRIGTWLKEHFPRIQFIVTTHSPYVCQAADPGGLIRLSGPDVDEPPRVVSTDLYERIVYGTGDDAVLSELFGLDTPYSPRAVELREQLAELEFRVAAGQADDSEVARWNELRDLLSSSPVTRTTEVANRAEADDR